MLVNLVHNKNNNKHRYNGFVSIATGKLVNLLSTDSVRTFSPGSVAIYVLKNDMNRPELVANLNVSNGPHGIYMLKITPQLSDDDEPQENYNLLINTEFDQQFQKQDTDSLNCKYHIKTTIWIFMISFMIFENHRSLK